MTLRSRSQTLIYVKDFGLSFHESISPEYVDGFMLKFLVKVFISLYLFNMKMDEVYSLPVGRYWSEVLCCTIKTHLGDLEVKVMDFNLC